MGIETVSRHSATSTSMRIVICPGMGCDASSNWYRWFAGEMEKRKYVSEIILRNFPDQPKCRESIWIPFLKNQVGLDADTVVVGHSTGAACAMRMLEDKEIDKVRGVILVAAAYTDLGDEWEAASEEGRLGGCEARRHGGWEAGGEDQWGNQGGASGGKRGGPLPGACL